MTTVSGVQRPEYDPDEDGGDLQMTTDGLAFDSGEDALRVPHEQITAVDVETDRSLTGFRRLGTLFGLFGLLFTAPSVPLLLAGQFTPVATGLYISAALSYYGVWFCTRLEEGPLSVLSVETDQRETQFLALGTDAFDDIVGRVRRRGR